MAQARSARAINLRGKERGSVIYSTDREHEVSKIFIAPAGFLEEYITVCNIKEDRKKREWSVFPVDCIVKLITISPREKKAHHS